jgi:hypothetical protein
MRQFIYLPQSFFQRGKKETRQRNGTGLGKGTAMMRMSESQTEHGSNVGEP